ncbi:MAG: DnaD domain protein, partial [Clostridia bacterium]|nr:DnaD domain protein [Clostridia bacterium]
MAEYLGIKEAQVISAFEYWKSVGLVNFTSTSPLNVIYNYIPAIGGKIHKFKQGRFTDFNAQMQALFPHRMITPNEYDRYYEFIESSKIKDESLIMIAGYCVANKGDGIRSNYILAVARDWLNLGIRTPEDVEEKIRQAEACTDILREISRALGKKTLPDFEDRQLYLKWRDSWGFDNDVILAAAATCKNRGGMSRLDTVLDGYFRLNLFTLAEIEAYNDNRRKLLNTAKEIARILGTRYDNYDYFIEKYITPWSMKGFDKDALILIAEQCFIKGTKSPEGMNTVVAKFLKEGCLSAEAIRQYLSSLAARDEVVAKVIKTSGSSRNITNNDRDMYALWSI